MRNPSPVSFLAPRSSQIARTVSLSVRRADNFGMGDGLVGLALGASVLGLTHGLQPGHGWAIAASYALDKPNKWLYGAVTSLLLGIGHLVSSVAMVFAYFWAISYVGISQLDWMHYVAGVLLVALGIWQYVRGHDHGHDDHDHGDHDRAEADPDRGLVGIVTLAFALGFTHNEEFDIIAICTGSTYCLELMLLYSLAVIVSLVGATLLLIAGYERYEARLEGYTEYLPVITAVILVLMGFGFILGVF